MRSVIEDLDAAGIRIVSCGILEASGRPQTSLTKTLASHAMIHSAEGELFRNAIIAASQQLQVPVTAVKQRDLTACVKTKLGIDHADLMRRVNGMRASLGPPWTQDEKLASVAAWLSLVSRPR
jgi:hypothetical protein